MKKLMQYAPVTVVVVLLALQIPRVTSFVNHVGGNFFGALIFALAVSGGIFVASYFRGLNDYVITADKEDKRAYSQQIRRAAEHGSMKNWATVALIMLVVADGIFNLADVFSNKNAVVNPFTAFAAVLYGALPTVMAWVFGEMQGKIKADNVSDNGPDIVGALIGALVKRIEKTDTRQEKAVNTLLTDDALIDYIASNPGASLQAIGNHFGVTRQAIDGRARRLVKVGRLDKGIDGKLTAKIATGWKVKVQ